MELFVRHRGVTDDVTFFTSDTHPPLPLEIIEERAALLARRMPQVRERGYRTGINVLSTIGHHNENLRNSLSGDYTWMMDIGGGVCKGTLCPNDERSRRYVEQLYTLIADAGPDYIWIDDDVRLYGHSPILAGCFCDKCLSLFEGNFGAGFTRESLQEAFNNGAVEKKLEVRLQWLEHNRNTISSLLALIEQTVHRAKPGLPLGFMTGDRFFEGYDFDRWAEALSGPARAEVMWRPGGGFYADDPISGLAGKAHDIGRQVSMLPQSVVCIQSEIENFPYQRLKKSARVTALEAAAYLAAGCTGAAFNVLSMLDEPLDEYEPLIARLKQARPFLDLLASRLGRSHPIGAYTGWNKNVAAAGNIDQGDWLRGNIMGIGASHAAEVFEIGIPPSYSPEHASVTLLTGDCVPAMSEEEILRALSSGVYMDAQALTRLSERGYEQFTGFTVERYLEADCIEEFVAHPLNTTFAGRRRDGRQSFWKRPAAILKPCQEQAETLARVVDYVGLEVGPCGMGVFENSLGGRVCAAGYYPWMFLQSYSKASQLKSIMRWLSRDNLAAYCASFHKINLWARELKEGKLAVALINSSLDPAENVTLMLRTASEEASIFDMDCAEMRIRSSGTDGACRSFVLPAIGGWGMRLVIA